MFTCVWTFAGWSFSPLGVHLPNISRGRYSSGRGVVCGGVVLCSLCVPRDVGALFKTRTTYQGVLGNTGFSNQGIFLENSQKRKAEQNPWKSNTLEWTAPVEHMHGNWPGKIPQVFRCAYDYSKPGKEEDFVPQSVPIANGEKITEH